MSKVLLVAQTEVQELLPMSACIDLMEQTLVALSRGQLQQRLRTFVRPTESQGLMVMMPAFRSSVPQMYALKTVCVFPQNPSVGKDAHQGGVLLFSGETGEVLTFINASAITQIRTAAVSAVATRKLARADASRLAIIGAGVQARSHIEAISCVRKLSHVTVASRSKVSAQRFAREVESRYPFPVEAAEDAQAAIEGAHMVVTVTTSRDPVVRREWVSSGTHINAVGAYSCSHREIDSKTMADASVFVDRRESALTEAGDYVIPAKEGLIGPEKIKAELGDVLAGTNPGRLSTNEITLFKSLGLAVEDLAAAEYVFLQAQLNKIGTWVEF